MNERFLHTTNVLNMIEITILNCRNIKSDRYCYPKKKKAIVVVIAIAYHNLNLW